MSSIYSLEFQLKTQSLIKEKIVIKTCFSNAET